MCRGFVIAGTGAARCSIRGGIGRVIVGVEFESVRGFERDRLLLLRERRLHAQSGDCQRENKQKTIKTRRFAHLTPPVYADRRDCNWRAAERTEPTSELIGVEGSS